MALNFNIPSTSAQSKDESWKAQAFLNIWVRRQDGSRAKIGAIALRESKAFEKALIERLQQDDGLEAMVNSMELDFQMADKPISAINIGF